MKQTYVLVVGAVLGTLFGILALCAVELHRQIVLAQDRIAVLESSCESQTNEIDITRNQMNTLRNQLDELQRWRVRVSLASRMGWGPAHRFIREFPSFLTEAQ